MENVQMSGSIMLDYNERTILRNALSDPELLYERKNSSEVHPYSGSFNIENYGKDNISGAEVLINTDNTSFISSLESDALVWSPPEHDEVTIKDNVDHFDNGNDIDNWVRQGDPTSLGNPTKDEGINHICREERNKDVIEAVIDQFNFLVSRLLASDGILNLKEETGESWLDVVAHLSWEAAHLVKPNANQGKEMDPMSYIKVKCIAHGHRNESKIIRGLVFKKNTAHKNMPTKLTNPRLLLLMGVLEENAAGLSSFSTMTEVKGNLQTIIDRIVACHTNVLLVEKTVSRDVQEALLEKGITLVFDMKLPRLERIARCTSSSIISASDIEKNTMLRQCEYFYIEKFIEEHNQIIEGGRKTTKAKTLMFFEGCPKPLGCTILLKGAHSDELKKVKRVMHYTIIAAYHLIFETSFFADQNEISIPIDALSIKEDSYFLDKIRSSTSLPSSAVSLNNLNTSGSACIGEEHLVSNGNVEISELGVKQSTDRVIEAESYSTDVTSNGNANLQGDGNISNRVCHKEKSVLSVSLLPGQFLPFASARIRNVWGEHLSLHSVGSCDSLSSHVGNNEKDQFNQYIGQRKKSPPLETINTETEVLGKTCDEYSEDAKIEPVSDVSESLECLPDVSCKQDNTSQKGGKDALLDLQSILILFSSQSILKDIFCEQRALTRIKYYGNFDMSLGRLLQEILLSQTHSCLVCHKSPESHIYSYTHQNGRLTVQVKVLPRKLFLSGFKEGNIWMWTRCLKCQHESGIPKVTKRVVMSTAARGLSFGKFLELSFSSQSAARALLSSCGHLLHRDCIRFFGLGSKVAVFTYSPLEIYDACKPPPQLDFSSVGQTYLEKELKEVQQNGYRFFSEVECFLQKMRCNLSGKPVNIPVSIRDFSEIEEMLKQEKANFNMKTANHDEPLGKPSLRIFDVTCLNQELLLHLYVWDCRFEKLTSYDTDDAIADESIESIGHKQITEQSNIVNECAQCDEGDHIQEEVKSRYGSDPFTSIDIEEPDRYSNPSFDQELIAAEALTSGNESNDEPSKILDVCLTKKINEIKGRVSMIASAINQGEFSTLATAFSFDETSSMVTSPMGQDIDVRNINIEDTNCDSDVPVSHAVSMDSQNDLIISSSFNIVVEGSEDWIWRPFQVISKDFWKNYSRGHLSKFEFIFTYSPVHLSPMNQVISQEKDRLCYTFGDDDGFMVSIHEDEVSSIIACALVHDTQDEKEVIENEKGYAENKNEDVQSLSMDGSEEILHPKIQLGFEGNRKNKYLITCIHAKQFYDLRKQCFPSKETAYISSLSRCKKWNAQGGKSKALFAKTLDNRFIIKEINKTELTSFLEFAPEYFHHVSGSLRSGSQTCLAKVFGIYQVKQIKAGKEVKVDVMVMENLLCGRNITRMYDLKGAVFSRYVSDPNRPGAVLLDQNFVEDMGLSPLYVQGRTKQLLQRAIWNDTSFLTSINVMDYSLLLGVDKDRKQLVFGIIDYFRQYTWDKQLETWAKASLVVPKNSSPTVVSPVEYKKRFRKFMSKYFLSVPDSWTS